MALSFSGVETFGNPVSFVNSPISINVTTRLCLSGEEYTTDGKCVVCLPDTYLYNPPTHPTACKSCDPNAKCYGGNVVAPLSGYWRSSNTSSDFVACPRPSSCLAGN